MSEPVDGTFEGAPRLGAMFGRYRIDAVIGRGGMGVVFRATDTDLDRVVALKFPAPELPTDQAIRDRFVRESRLAAAIEHPHIVPIYEAGSVSGTLFIAMRYVQGEDLAQVIRREAPLDVARVLAITGQIAEALDAAHAERLIHRDVKPGNVLLEDRGNEWAWLSDFGLTRRMGGSLAPSVGGLAGSVDYMAPEVIQNGVVDGRADQYSLASVVVHCLTGVPPFEGAAEASVLYAHVHQEPRGLPETVGRREILEPVLLRALAKDPADRFRDCGTFAAALRGDRPAVDVAVVSGPAASTHPSSDDGVAARSLGGQRTGSRVPRWVVGALFVALFVAAGAYLVNDRGTGIPAGSPTPRVGTSGSPGPVALTGPEGVIVFAGNNGGNYDIWAVLPDGSELTPLTDDPVRERAPDVSPDGSLIVFAAGPDGSRDLFSIQPDGSERTRLTTWKGDDYAPAFSPDGRSIAWTSDRSGNEDIWIMTDQGAGFAEAPVTNITHRATPDYEHQDQYPSWFPDGRIAFSSSRAEGSDIWVVDPAREDRPWALTTDGRVDSFPTVGDYFPTVAPNGDVVFTRRVGLDRDLFVVTGRGSKPRQLTKGATQHASPDVSPDGRGLVFVESDDAEAGGSQLVVTTAAGRSQRTIPLKLLNAQDPAWVAGLGSE